MPTSGGFSRNLADGRSATHPVGDTPGVRELPCAGGWRALYRVAPDTGSDSTAGDVRVLRIHGPGQDRILAVKGDCITKAWDCIEPRLWYGAGNGADAMCAAAQKRMNVDEFLAWAMEQPEGTHYELVSGQIIAMAPERAMHGMVKARLAQYIANAIDAAGLPCRTFVDSMAVRVNANTIYEPDVMVRCGESLHKDAIEVTDPMIVIEVVSPSSAKRDSGSKLADYLSIPSVRHYLIVLTDNPTIIHHRRDDTGAIATTILRNGAITLDPPGIALSGIFDDL